MNNIRTTKKFWVLLQLFVLVFVFNFSFIPYAHAATLSELQQQQKDLDSQIEEKKEKIEYKKQEIGTIEEEIGELDGSIDNILSKIADVDAQIAQSKNDIEKVNEEIVVKEREIANQEENQAETLRTIYESFKTTSTMRMIIGSSTLSQLINYSSYLEALQNKIESIIDEVTKLKLELENKKKELELKKLEQEQLQEQNKAYERGLEEQRAVKDMLLDNKEAEKSSLEAQIEEVKATRSQVEAQISAAIAAARQGSGISARDKGVSDVGFMWPTDGGITAYFNDPEYFDYFGFPHYGLDIANDPGTPIYAASSGTITTAMAFGSYGNCIIIGHNARFVSLYAHLMYFAVSPGDEVKTGDVIGYMGSTGFSTGPHLHFEIREYGTPKDPLIYLP